MNLINIHLFHDPSNLVSMETVSFYNSKFLNAKAHWASLSLGQQLACDKAAIDLLNNWNNLACTDNSK